MVTPDEARAILAQRAKNDPLVTYEPGPTQQAIMLDPARFRILRGPSRSGKTSHCAVELALAALRRHPTRSTKVNGLYVVFGPSWSQIADPWGKKLLKESELLGDNFSKPMIPAHEIEHIGYNPGNGTKAPREIVLKNGNKLLFSVSGDKNVWKRVEGKGMVLGIFIDEMAGNEALIATCMTRLLDANSHPQVREEAGGGFVMWGATPTMNNTAMEDLVDKAKQGSKDIRLYELNWAENPAISVAEREKLKEFLSEDDYAIRVVGDASAMTGSRVYPQWDDNRHVLKEDYVVQDNDSLYLGYDPGVNYTGMSIHAFNAAHPLRAHVVRCWEPRRTTLEAQARIIADWLQGRKLEAIMYDQNGRKIDGSGSESIIFKLQRLLKEAGIQVHQGTKMGINAYPESVGIVRQMLTQGNLVINPSLASGCPILRSQFLAYRFRDKSVELKQDNILRGNDHILDSVRYCLSRKPCWVNRGPNRVDPQWAQKHMSARPVDGRILTDEQLRERQKMQASAQIAKGNLPGINNKGLHRLF